ncbi:metallophosphoesterase [Cochlodiniinecator piscidefendens]|uniref:metallophosphoesterase n=1 Tax=Cochlodiniinecator piscidefendens TaxID=2715756 RepID=UPI00140B7831|nr:metallophosphoesterase [Cochlodiniinecator piscidefendens]
MTNRIYAIGDIHGHLDKLKLAHDLIAKDKSITNSPDALIVHIGDLVDRGPESAGVISHLSQGQSQGAPWIVLKGNHDRMFEGFLKDPSYQDPVLRTDLTWLHERLGGITTLKSYGVLAPAQYDLQELHAEALVKVPQEHLTYLENLPTSFQIDGLFFAHAGVKPGRMFSEQTEDDLLWIRKEFLEDMRDHGALIVHGHTPIDAATNYGNRVNIDGGAAFGRALYPIVIEGQEISLLTPDGRNSLPPQK